MVQKLYVTYNEVHKLCQESADQILNDFRPTLMIAIGGGGYVPARILRYTLLSMLSHLIHPRIVSQPYSRPPADGLGITGPS